MIATSNGYSITEHFTDGLMYRLLEIDNDTRRIRVTNVLQVLKERRVCVLGLPL
jgi:hypothetical protein